MSNRSPTKSNCGILKRFSILKLALGSERAQVYTAETAERNKIGIENDTETNIHGTQRNGGDQSRNVTKRKRTVPKLNETETNISET